MATTKKDNVYNQVDMTLGNASPNIDWLNSADEFGYEKIHNIEKSGVIEWNPSYPYILHARTMGSDGHIYRSLEASNTGNNPISSPLYWTRATNSISVITQVGHGFSVGNWVKRIPGEFILAQADSIDNSNAVGVINEVISVDEFVLVETGGIADQISSVDGVYYWLDPNTAGAMTNVKPSNTNEIAVFLGYADIHGFHVNVDVGSIIDDLFIGIPFPYPVNTIPTSYIAYDGSSLNTTIYNKLFAVLGFTYGGSGASFNVPDMRKEFIRGYDGGILTNPIGIVQLASFINHTHLFDGPTGGSGSYSHNNSSGAFKHTLSNTTASSGASVGSGSETRPTNYAMLYIARYK